MRYSYNPYQFFLIPLNENDEFLKPSNQTDKQSLAQH